MLGYFVSAAVGMVTGAAGVVESRGAESPVRSVQASAAAPASPAAETGFECQGWGPQTSLKPELFCDIELAAETRSLSVRSCRLSVSPGFDRPNETVSLRWTGATERAVVFESQDRVTQVVVATGGEHIGKARIRARSGYYRCSSAFTLPPTR